MAGIVFSKLEPAMNAAEELKNEIDADVYVIKRCYPSGDEFFLSQFEREGCVYSAYVKPTHVFSGTKDGKKKAFEYAKKFDMFVQQNKVKQNGYEFTKSYTLVKNMPEDV